MKSCLLTFFFFVPFILLGQAPLDTQNSNERYFEDQFYAGLTYNFLANKDGIVKQRNFSYGLQAGFIKDIPFNKSRTFGIGLGLGLALNTYYSNIRAAKSSNVVTYAILEDNSNLNRSKIETHLIELPFEFRWRNSDPNIYSFWRIYSGLKIAYAFDSRSKLITDETTVKFKNTDVRKLQYGFTLNIGYHNVNLHIYYALKPLFENSILESGELLRIKPVRVGFTVYML